MHTNYPQGSLDCLPPSGQECGRQGLCLVLFLPSVRPERAFLPDIPFASGFPGS